jgi:hypothetical protein
MVKRSPKFLIVWRKNPEEPCPRVQEGTRGRGAIIFLSAILFYHKLAGCGGEVYMYKGYIL